MQTFTGNLSGIDYGDTFSANKATNTYDYKLTCTGASHVNLKVKAFVPALLGEAPSAATWLTLEDRRCDAGETVTGVFSVPQTRLSSSMVIDSAQCELHFTRAILSGGVQYKLEIQHR